jgi:glycosyltransferase involved in cell wall biosynthesis
VRPLRFSVVATTHPLTVGAAPFNSAMVAALRRRAEVDFLSWRRPYPPLLYRGSVTDERSRPQRIEPAEFVLDWHDPRTWRRALRRIEAFRPDAVVIPWLHPVTAPPHSWLLRRIPQGVARVVVCHNVESHERVRLGTALTRATLRHADLLVTHAPHQRGELAALGLGRIEVAESFHPRFVAGDLAVQPSPDEVARERDRLGNPELLLLCFGAVRPYKGVDVALDALAHVDPRLDVRLVVAGRFWQGSAPFEERVRELGLDGRVELRDRYVSNEEAALLFRACDAAVLPYRSASQSGVVGLSFAHDRPVVATRVGGLPQAVRDGVDGLLCPPEQPAELARAIERLAVERERLTAGVRRGQDEQSFDRYADVLSRAVSTRG